MSHRIKIVDEKGNEVILDKDDPDVIELMWDLDEVNAHMKKRGMAKLVKEVMVVALHDLPVCGHQSY